MPSPPPVRCGPAGWAYPHWDAVVYPRPKPRGFHPLEYLAHYFDTAEIDPSAGPPLRPELSRLWLKKVSANPSLMFTARLPRRFTHERLLNDAEMEAFRLALRPIHTAGKLGCLLMQFPWSFRFTEENREFFVRLRRAFHQFPLVAEMRHSSWMRQEALGLFIDYHVGFCNIDQPAHTHAMPPTALLTTAVGYVRLHGRNYGNWFLEFDDSPAKSSRRDYLYSPAELEEWKVRIEHIRRFADSVYVVTTNDAGGRSVINALQLQAALGQPTRALPRHLARACLGKPDAVLNPRPTQTGLFPRKAVA